MVDFASFKKNSSNDILRLQKALEKLSTPSQQEKEADERFWKLTEDKAGNGSAIIRFLPPPAVDGEDAMPWVRIWDHGFQVGNKWYIEKSLTTLNLKDPVSELNSQLWNSTNDDDSPARKQARNQKRRLSYYSNILVISDPANRDNEGKVFLFKYGKKIFDKAMSMLKPEFDGDDPVNVFDAFSGCNFRLRRRRVAGFPNYDESRFDSPTAIGDDEMIERIWKSSYSLKELVDPKHFKSYDELKKRLDEVLGASAVPEALPAPKAVAKPAVAIDEPPFEVDSDDDEDLQAFKDLAK